MKNILALACFTGLLSAAGLPASADEVPNIEGHWVSAKREAQGKLFVTREFEISADKWSVIYHAFADAENDTPLFSLDVGGFYLVGGASTAVPGAYDGIFPAQHRTMTADSEAGKAMFATMGCALNIGEAKSLLAESCGFVPSQMQAMGEYDLVKLDKDELYFGDRTGDLSKARPTALYAFPLVRR